jgi:hypothetical protein
VRIALRILAQREHNISELSFDPFLIITGLNCFMLDRPGDEYNHFLALMKRPEFSHLNLPLFVGGNGTSCWPNKAVDPFIALLGKRMPYNISVYQPQSGLAL